MSEHLFKLKKDGKTVGYLKLAKGWTQFQALGREDWYYPCDFAWHTAHLFVTKDKNGKDVFAGDTLRSKDELRKYKVIWDERRCRWWLCGVDKAWAVNEPIWEDYEQIEEKKDD